MEKLPAQALVQQRVILRNCEEVLTSSRPFSPDYIASVRHEIDLLTALLNEQVGLWEGGWQAVDDYLKKNDPNHDLLGPWPRD